MTIRRSSPRSALLPEHAGARRLAAGLGGSAAILAGLALLARRWAHRAERMHPPIGRFVYQDSVRLHYVDVGDGPPVLLLHGVGALLQDLCLTLAPPLVSTNHRVLIFDRPGYGYSTRPGRRTWTAEAQAALLHATLDRLGVRRPLLVGHSWGATVALAYALAYPGEIRGAVLLSGFYYPVERPAIPLISVLAPKRIGRLLSATLAPFLARAAAPSVIRRTFAPNPVSPMFSRFPLSLCFRPKHLRAIGRDLHELRPSVERMVPSYGTIAAPVAILAGLEDRVVDSRRHSVCLHRQVSGSELRLFPDTGHMLHHVRPRAVLGTIGHVLERAAELEAECRRPVASERAKRVER